jgi:hypothetical protein
MFEHRTLPQRANESERRLGDHDSLISSLEERLARLEGLVAALTKAAKDRPTA